MKGRKVFCYYTKLFKDRERIVDKKQCLANLMPTVPQINTIASPTERGKIYANSRIEAEMILNQRREPSWKTN